MLVQSERGEYRKWKIIEETILLSNENNRCVVNWIMEMWMAMASEDDETNSMSAAGLSAGCW